MIYWLYARMLARQITVLPNQICIMIDEQDIRDAPDKVYDCVAWCVEMGISGVIFHISTRDPAAMVPFLPAIRRISSIAALTLHCGEHEEVSGKGIAVTVAVGKSGREEITACIRAMAQEHIAPEAVDETVFERHLTFRYTPDLVIKTGGDHLTDFLIWQSVYSELFFSDVNWKFLRKVDFLRALRDYQSRVRRFGA
jgi:undecaprenyl diphosphate synthase